jgi:integrating conjugative element protein (TIGR03756 family)
MRPTRAVCGVLGFLLCASASHRVAALDISTPEIAALSTSPSCLDYRIVGICFFLVCTTGECHIETTARISHYLPDVVVSSYQRTGDNPWTDVAELANLGSGVVAGLLGAAAGIAVEGGHQREGRLNQDHENVRFKETDVIGNPLPSVLAVLGRSGYLCRSEATSLTPYFLSTLDALSWRSGIPEMIYPASYVPGLREIGHFPFNTWGSVYPRQGFLNTSEDPKAAAVCAQRAADIVTRQGQPHAYRYLGGGNCGIGCTPPGPVFENAPLNSQWQLLRPLPSTRCEVFGQNDVAALNSWANHQQIDASEDYAWNLWRRYRCCWPHYGLYVGHLEFL